MSFSFESGFLLTLEPFWHQSKVLNSDLILSKRINRKFEFSKGVLSASELSPSKLNFAAIFLHN